MLATQFILEGVRAGETAVIAVFEKRPDEYLRTDPAGGSSSDSLAAEKMKLVYIRPLDLSVDEALEELQEAITRLGCEAGGRRLALGLRARSRASVSGRLPRVALQDDRAR